MSRIGQTRGWCRAIFIQSSKMLAALSPIERTRCVRCLTRMRLAKIAQGAEHSEKRIFECATCGATETRLVADPLDSDDLTRLTNNIRPPA